MRGKTLQSSIDNLHDVVQQNSNSGIPLQVNNSAGADLNHDPPVNPKRPSQPSAIDAVEPSKDFLAIPAARTTADTVLTWPVYEGKYKPHALISVLFVPLESELTPDSSLGSDTFVVPGGMIPPQEESIPLLVDRFLENVHTKNPVLDVEQLVKHSRQVSNHGFGWDAWSCLVLLASALGTIAKPFESAVNIAPSPSIDGATEITWTTDAPTTPRELQQAESLFVLACRRMGCLKHSMLGSHCYFFAGGSYTGLFSLVPN